MIVKNYIVKDMYEAMVLIKQDLGNDAVIINRKNVKAKGLFGFFKKSRLEVTAVIEDNDVNKKGIIKKVEDQKSCFSEDERYEEAVTEKPIVKEPKESMLETEIIKTEVKELKDIMTNFVSSFDQKGHEQNFNYGVELLKRMDVDHDIIKDYEQYYEKLKMEKEGQAILKDFLMTTVEKIKIGKGDKRIKMFVGPTGVGKTTTIAKIASNEALVLKKDVAMITLDTYRIGAVEQLRIYADILGITIKVVYSEEDFEKALNAFEDKDLILIDSTGRSYKNVHKLREMQNFSTKIKDIEKYLVLSMTTKSNDFVEIIKSYENIGFDNIILTKFDETSTYGNILNLAYNTDNPISYISTGQEVPDDIKNATRENLYKYVWSENQYEGSGI